MRVALAAALLIAAAAPALADGAAPQCVIDPARPGKRITDQRQLIGFGITASRVALHETDKQGVLVYAEPQWCKEGEFSVEGQHFMLWHNMSMSEPNLSGPYDRITRADHEPDDGSTMIYALADRLAQTTRRDGDPPAPAIVYHIMLQLKDEIWIVGSYDQPPPPEEMARFALGRSVPINVRIDKKTKKTTLYAPT